MGVFRGGGAILSADPWDDRGGTRPLDIVGGPMGGGSTGKGGRGVGELQVGRGGWSDAANGVVRELTWENSALQRRVEVQANALIEMSVEKERWVAERAHVQHREKEAQERARLLLEEKTQLKESLQSVIEGLLDENTSLKTNPPLIAAATKIYKNERATPHTSDPHAHSSPLIPATSAHIASPPKPTLPPLNLPTHTDTHTLTHAHPHHYISHTPLPPDHHPSAATTPRTTPGRTPRHTTTPRAQVPPGPPPPQPHITPFLGVAVGATSLVGGGGGGCSPLPAMSSPLPASEGAIIGEDDSPVTGRGEGVNFNVTCPSRNLEWSLLLSPRCVLYVCNIEAHVHVHMCMLVRECM